MARRRAPFGNGDGAAEVNEQRAGATRRVLAVLDADRARAALDGVFDKLTSGEEAGVMVDGLADDYPGLAAIVNQVALRIDEEAPDADAARHIAWGCALGMLAVIQYGQAEELRAAAGLDEH